MRTIVQLFIMITIIVAVAYSAGIAGVGGSKHDFSLTGDSNFSGTFTGDNDEICVYCHTPHNSYGSQTPLWNKNLDFSSGFTVYSSSTMNSVPLDPPSTISLLCLSCHDGVGAINSVLNSPGPDSAGITATGDDQIGDLGPLGLFVNIGEGDPGSPGPVDLSNDHPVSIDWDARGSGFHATPTDVRLKLFGSDDDMIECSTCHDVHNGTPFEIGGVQFLSMSNAGSSMCLACHIK